MCIRDRYWLVQFQDSLYIIDQHAAHERVMYERTLKEMKSREYKMCIRDRRPDVCGGGADLIIKLFHKLSSCMGCCAYCICLLYTSVNKSIGFVSQPEIEKLIG